MRYNFYPYDDDEWYEDDYIDHSQYPLTFEVAKLEPDLLSVLYGPDGEVLIELYEAKMPFGFNRE